MLGNFFIIDFELSDGVVVIDEVFVLVDCDSCFIDGKIGFVVNIFLEKIIVLLIISCSINDFMCLMLQFNGMFFVGINFCFNNYIIDGNIYNNNFGFGFVQFVGGNLIFLDVIEVVSVNLVFYDVCYFGFIGVFVNVVIKFGINKFSGFVYYFICNDQMQGNRVGDLVIDIFDFCNEIYGVILGGLIIKNKLFFFVVYEREVEIFFFFFIKSVVWLGEELDGLVILCVLIEEVNFVCDQIQSFYGYDVGVFDGYGFVFEQQCINVCFDYNISENYKVSFCFNDYFFFSDVFINNNLICFIQICYWNIICQGVENINFCNNNYINDCNVCLYVVEFNFFFGNKVFNQLNVGYIQIVDFCCGIFGDQAFFFIEVLELDVFGNFFYYMSMGNELFSVGNLFENNVFNVINNIIFFFDCYMVIVGVNFEYMIFDNVFNLVFNGFYCFIGYQNFVDVVINQDQFVFFDVFVKSYVFDGFIMFFIDEIWFGQIGVYIQDEYQVNENFKFIGGLCVDLLFYLIDLFQNELFVVENKIFMDNDGDIFMFDVSVFFDVNLLFFLCVGFNYDVNGDCSMVICGGIGLFFGCIFFVWFFNQVNGFGVVWGGFGFEGQEVIDEGIVFNFDVIVYNFENLGQMFFNELNLIDIDFCLLQVWRLNIGFDQKLFGGIDLILEFMYNCDVYMFVVYNVVLCDVDEIFNGFDQCGYWIDQLGLSGYSNDEDFCNVFYLINVSEKVDYFVVIVQFFK